MPSIILLVPNKITFCLLGYGKKKRDNTFYGNHEPECSKHCGTIEDCFDLPCPRYGFCVRYTFTRNVSFESSQENEKQYFDTITARQTGEGFRSASAPECRITVG